MTRNFNTSIEKMNKVKLKSEFEMIKQLLILLGYTNYQEIDMTTDLIHFFENPKTKDRINITFEKC